MERIRSTSIQRHGVMVLGMGSWQSVQFWKQRSASAQFYDNPRGFEMSLCKYGGLFVGMVFGEHARRNRPSLRCIGYRNAPAIFLLSRQPFTFNNCNLVSFATERVRPTGIGALFDMFDVAPWYPTPTLSSSNNDVGPSQACVPESRESQ